MASELDPGDEVELLFVRDGESLSATVVAEDLGREYYGVGLFGDGSDFDLRRLEGGGLLRFRDGELQFESPDFRIDIDSLWTRGEGAEFLLPEGEDMPRRFNFGDGGSMFFGPERCPASMVGLRD